MTTRKGPPTNSVSFPDGEIVFGTGSGIASSPELTFAPTTGFGPTPGLLIGVNPDSIPYKLAIGGVVTGEESLTAIKSILHVIPQRDSANIIGINSEIFGDDGNSGLTDKSVEMYGGYIEVTALSTNGATGIRGLHVAVRSGLGAAIDKAVGIEIGAGLGGAFVGQSVALDILNGFTRAIVTRNGLVEFGDNVECLSGLKVGKLAGVGIRAVMVDEAGNLTA